MTNYLTRPTKTAHVVTRLSERRQSKPEMLIQPRILAPEILAVLLSDVSVRCDRIAFIGARESQHNTFFRETRDTIKESAPVLSRYMLQRVDTDEIIISCTIECRGENITSDVMIILLFQAYSVADLRR